MAAKEEFWQGEWVCIDCGYIYEQSEPIKFEELPSNFRYVLFMSDQKQSLAEKGRDPFTRSLTEPNSCFRRDDNHNPTSF